MLKCTNILDETTQNPPRAHTNTYMIWSSVTSSEFRMHISHHLQNKIKIIRVCVDRKTKATKWLFQ